MEAPNRLTEAVQELRRLMDLKDVQEDALKSTNKLLKELKERVIPKIMEDGEIEQARIEKAGTVSITQQLYVSMTPASDEDAEAPFYDWARENAPDLIKPYIHPGRLKSWAGECLEQGVALPDNMLKATFVPTAKLLRRG